MPDQNPDAFSHSILHQDELRHWHTGRIATRGMAASARTIALVLSVFSASFLGTLNYPHTALAAALPAFVAESRIALQGAADQVAGLTRSAPPLRDGIPTYTFADANTAPSTLQLAAADASSFTTYLTSLWHSLTSGNSVTATNTEPSALYVPPRTRIASSTSTPQVTPAETRNTTSAPSVTYVTTNPVIERIITQSAPDSASFTTQLQSLKDDLLSRIANLATSGANTSSVIYQTIGQASKIDALSGTSLTNVVVHGVSGLTAGDIPALAYLATAGGTLAGDLTINGALSVAAAIQAPYFTATSTSAWSTFPNLLSTNSTTTNATSTNLFATASTFTSSLISTLTATIANFTSITATNATTTNLSVTNTASALLYATSTPTAGNFIATSTTASQFPYASSTAVTVSGTASTSKLIASNTFTLATLSGFLKATAGLVGTALVNLASDVTGILPVGNGGTGWAAIQSGTIPYGNGTGAVATSSALTFDGTKLIATYASTTAITSSGSAYFATGGGNVGIGTTTPAYKLNVTGAASQFGLDRTAISGYSEMAFTTGTVRDWTIGTRANDSGLYFNANSAGTLNALYLGLTGNVGIGTTAPADRLQITNSSGSSGGLRVTNNDYVDGSAGSALRIGFGASSGSTYSYITGTTNGFSSNNGNIVLAPSGGNVGIGVTNPGDVLDITGSNHITASFTSTAGDPDGVLNLTVPNVNTVCPGNLTCSEMMEFVRTGQGIIGNITPNSGGTGVIYNTTSDYRLKENIATTTTGLATLLQIPVDDFNFITDPSKERMQGFIAQELDKVYPEAVATNGDNGIVPLGASSTPWSVDYGRITPLIVKAVQDIANLSDSFKQTLIAWLGNAGNGITDLFATTIHADNVNANSFCAKKSDGTNVCINGDQLASLLSGQTASAASAGVGSVPTITVDGENPAHIAIGAAYSDLGARITGPSDADKNLGLRYFVDGVMMDTVAIDTATSSTHSISYVATNASGSATSTRTVVVAASAGSIATSTTATSTTDASSTNATSTQQ